MGKRVLLALGAVVTGAAVLKLLHKRRTEREIIPIETWEEEAIQNGDEAQEFECRNDGCNEVFDSQHGRRVHEGMEH